MFRGTAPPHKLRHDILATSVHVSRPYAVRTCDFSRLICKVTVQMLRCSQLLIRRFISTLRALILLELRRSGRASQQICCVSQH
jgi:hypothetical protein